MLKKAMFTHFLAPIPLVMIQMVVPNIRSSLLTPIQMACTLHFLNEVLLSNNMKLNFEPINIPMIGCPL